MTNLIPVKQVKDDRGNWDIDKTLSNTLKAIFGEDVPTGYTGYQGVKIYALRRRDTGYHGYWLVGIQLETADSYYKKVFRKVMVKNDQIDADAVKAKFAELKAIAAGAVYNILKQEVAK